MEGLQVLKLRSGFQWSGVFAAALILFQGAAYGKRYTGELVKIVDGDTVHVRAQLPGDKDPVIHKIRYLGMDTPELHFNGAAQLPWAQEATDRLHELFNATEASLNRGGAVIGACKDKTTGQPITVEIDPAGQDAHSRDLAYVFIDGKNTNLVLTEEGWAWPYLYCAKGDCDKTWEKRSLVKEFQSACKEARKDKVGVWDAKNGLTEMPSDFRRRIDRGKRYQFIGNFETKKLYAPDDQNKVDPCLQIRFQVEADALALGYQY